MATQKNEPLWDGVCLVGHSAWLFSGVLQRVVTMRAPVSQVIISKANMAQPISPSTLPPDAAAVFVVPPGVPAGPPVAPIDVFVLALDPATLLAQRLCAVAANVPLEYVDHTTVRAAADEAINQSRLDPLVEAFARAFCWRESPAQLLARASAHQRLERMMRELDTGGVVDSVQHAAEISCLSFRRFCDVFRTEVGLPCSDYLALQRLFKMLWLMADKNISITHAAASVGFFDLSHLNRSLKRFIDISATDLYGMRAKRERTATKVSVPI
jgi:methylphosphotriester-DNA--protein-cysteine methyltransferase